MGNMHLSYDLHISCVMFHIFLYHLASFFFMPVYSKDVDTRDNCIYSKVSSLYETVTYVCTV